MDRRKNIWEFSTGDRASLAAAIKQYIGVPGVDLYYGWEEAHPMPMGGSTPGMTHH